MVIVSMRIIQQRKILIYTKNQLCSFADLQIRTVNYNMKGIASKRQNITQKTDYSFFNPKFGLTYVGRSSALSNKLKIKSEFRKP